MSLVLTEEEYLMIRDLAQEQEITTGRVNISVLSKQLNYDRKTIRKYLSQPTSLSCLRRDPKPSKLDPYKEHITHRLGQFPLLSSIRVYEEIQNQGYSGGYTIVKDYIRLIRPTPTKLPEIRYETKPGVQAQVDWADCTYVLPDGDLQKVNCFSMILGYSRMRFVEFTTSTDLTTFLICHQHAFDYFGGLTQEILYDNLKVVVIKRKYPSTDSNFNPVFADFRDHYGFKSYLCRPYRAKTKGKIERAIRYIKDNFVYGRVFASVSDLNIQARQWMEKVNHQVHGTTFEKPVVRFLKEELHCINSIPRYIIKKRESRKVSADCYISLYGNRYSVPWQYSNRMVEVEIVEQRVQIVVDGAIVGEHLLLEGKKESSRNKEHFQGLLKAARDETKGKMPSLPSGKKQGSSDDLVEKRSLSEYDQLRGDE